MIQDLAGSNRLTLVENKRSDQALFDFYTSLSSRSLAEVLHEARILFPLISREAETTLVISRARRRFHNCQRNLRERPPDAVFPRARMTGKAGNGPQSMWVWSGLRLFGAGGPVMKGVFKSVAQVSEDGGVTLHSGVSLKVSQAIRFLRLCLAHLPRP